MTSDQALKQMSEKFPEHVKTNREPKSVYEQTTTPNNMADDQSML